MSEFKVGDVVTWESQAGGSTKKKTGEVVAVLPADVNVAKVLDSFQDHSFPSGVFGSSRNHESYLVSVPHSGKGKPFLYWPLVRLLKKKLAPAPKNQLPGLPDPGELHNLTQAYFDQQGLIDNAETLLKKLGEEIASSMVKEWRTELRCDKNGKPYMFKVVQGKARLRVMRAKKEAVLA